MKLNMKLLNAGFEGNLEELKQLIEDGANIRNAKDSEGNTCFMEACLMGCDKVVMFIIENLDNYGININSVNYKQKSALHKAAFNGHH
jgi:ankyrin repeat protein